MEYAFSQKFYPSPVHFHHIPTSCGRMPDGFEKSTRNFSTVQLVLDKVAQAIKCTAGFSLEYTLLIYHIMLHPAAILMLQNTNSYK